ncbi:MAG: histidine phosphatase family protein [Anaerolineae bacterium]|nr:histidine phosphatase family protein [Anaerolineae bacterium]
MGENSGLTELGWHQTHLVADWLARNVNADALLASTLTHAIQTAEVIGQRIGVPVEVFPGFEEADQPYWQELPIAPDQPLALWDSRWQPDAEHAPLYAAFREKLRKALARLLEEHENQTVIVVSHGGAIGTILRSLFGGHQMPVFTENGGVTQVAWQEGRWRLICHNERAHLTESSTPAVLPWSAPGRARTVIDHFDRVAAIMSPASSAQLDAGLRALVALAAPRPADKALDIGTGIGAVAFAFAPHVAHVTAIDISPAMLERAEQSRQGLAAVNMAIRWADAITLPHWEATFDLVTCRDLCPYVRDTAALFAQSRRVLKVGGRLVLDELIGSENPVKRATHQAIETQRDPAFGKLYSESEIELRLKECGLRIERAEVYDRSVDPEEWLTQAAANKDTRTAVTKMMQESIDGDATGLRIQRGKNGEITFTQRRLRLLARAPAG